jgi:hypothetical protein
MPASKHRRRGKTRPRSVPPPCPPRRALTDEERREDALLEERLHQLFGPPSTVHQGGDIDWDYEQYQETLAQLEAEGLIRPASEVVG